MYGPVNALTNITVFAYDIWVSSIEYQRLAPAVRRKRGLCVPTNMRISGLCVRFFGPGLGGLLRAWWLSVCHGRADAGAGLVRPCSSALPPRSGRHRARSRRVGRASVWHRHGARAGARWHTPALETGSSLGSGIGIEEFRVCGWRSLPASVPHVRRGIVWCRVSARRLALSAWPLVAQRSQRVASSLHYHGATLLERHSKRRMRRGHCTRWPRVSARTDWCVGACVERGSRWADVSARPYLRSSGTAAL